tara:strand:+ start:696 stop:1082 length:387 start_codon:yes stop_codon:yes gene_type:complete
MKKIVGLLISLTLLTGCAESLALLGPTTSAVGSGNVAQSAFTSAVSFGIKKQTGKSPSEHAVAYVKKHNPDNKKDKCIEFIEATNSKACAAIKKNITETKEYFKNKKKILARSKIENLARESDIYNRR